ncbi:MAG TPA: hypothetical protein VFZ21_05395 [Gemmatimonadaceae bacterium]|jgi:hypothetical protein|nr:hypothetical protein [Gemmatimonadaceae bacterium]
MRAGDFSVEIIAAGGGTVRELESGHVLARPGQVYFLRLRNLGPLRAVADISIDGHSVTGGGLVIDAWSTVNLERPIHATERGRFTVIAEGDETVFGPDGGRDNPDLGLIEARFRRELPGRERREAPRMPAIPRPIVTMPGPTPPTPAPTTPGRPFTPPEWTPPTWQASLNRVRDALGPQRFDRPTAFLSPSLPLEELPAAPAALPDAIERAAGTGLTGTSSQEFVTVEVGRLESEATVIRLRLVVGSEAAIDAPRPLPDSDEAPARPAARP